MRRKLMYFFVILFFLFSFISCKHNSTAPSSEVNIMCLDSEKELFQNLYGAGFKSDNSLAKVNCLTEEDYLDFDDWYDSMLTSLLTHSHDFDIYMLSSISEKTYKLIKDHYYVDLSQEEVLTDYFNAMYPEIREWCSDGDEIFGFPLYVDYPMGICVNEEQTGSIGYTIKDIRTMDGLFDFCNAWSEQNTIPPTEETLNLGNYYVNYLVSNYNRATGELNLDTPELRTILAKCNQYLGETYLQDDDKLPYVDLDKPIVFLADVPFVSKQIYTPDYYPLLAGEAPGSKRYTSVIWFIINPYSENKQQAFKYIRLLAEGAKYTRFSHSLLYQEKDFYESDLLSGDDYQTYDKLYIAEQFNDLKEYLQRFEVGYGFPGLSDVTRIINAYIEDGNKTLDKAIIEAQDLLDTIQKEQYIGEE